MALATRRVPTPTLAHYRSAKPMLRQDFRLRCCYCTLHEGEFGGWRNFHVEHYQPKSRFPARCNDYTNLLYSCSTCNVLKGSSWHEGDPLTIPHAFLDPCLHDYELFFVPDGPGRIRGTIPSARYMIEKLDLNRTHLVELRQVRSLMSAIHGKAKEAVVRARALSKSEASQALEEAFGLVEEMSRFHLQQMNVEPYPF